MGIAKVERLAVRCSMHPYCIATLALTGQRVRTSSVEVRGRSEVAPAYGVRAACCRFLKELRKRKDSSALTCYRIRQRQQAARTPYASRRAITKIDSISQKFG